MMNYRKYMRQYFLPPEECLDWAKKDHIEKAPIWCSVDLRDGNQALIEPMSLEEKIEFFRMLVDIGFKEIEVGFPAASETEYTFLRALIERNMIPDDVTIQVLTQAREHIIRKTFEAVKGAPKAVVHLYNSTSVAQREQVFKKNKEEIKKLANEKILKAQKVVEARGKRIESYKSLFVELKNRLQQSEEGKSGQSSRCFQASAEGTEHWQKQSRLLKY